MAIGAIGANFSDLLYLDKENFIQENVLENVVCIIE